MTLVDPDAPSSSSAGLFGLTDTTAEAQTVVVSVPFAPTASYGSGTEKAPEAIIAASHQVELYMRPWRTRVQGKPAQAPFAEGIAMLAAPPAIGRWHQHARAHAEQVMAESGSVVGIPNLEESLRIVNAYGEQINAYVMSAVQDLLIDHRRVVTLGGDHAVAYGAIQAHAARFPGMGILHIDAHADLREDYMGFTWSHASIMHNVMTKIPHVAKIVQLAVRDYGACERDVILGSGGRIVPFFDADLAQARFDGTPWSRTVMDIVQALPDCVYVSLDIDGLDPSLCPHTGTPVPGGLTFPQLTYLLHAVVSSGRHVVGADLVEVVPGPDGNTWDANVAARVLYNLIASMVYSCPKTLK